MQNPAVVIRNIVGALNRWFEKAEQEEQDHLKELVHPVPDESVKHDRLKKTSAGIEVELGPSNGTSSLDSKGIPLPPAKSKSGDSGGGAQPAHAGKMGIAGMTKRQAGGMPPQGSAGGIVANEKDDTVYMQKNEIVARVGRHYERFGPKVASAVLTKLFLPNGLDLLLKKLDLNKLPKDDDNHRQIVGLIERVGVGEFCRIVGIRVSEDDIKRGTVSATPQKRNSPLPKKPTPRPNASMAKRQSEDAVGKPKVRPAGAQKDNAGASSRINTGNMDIKPVSLDRPSTD